MHNVLENRTLKSHCDFSSAIVVKSVKNGSNSNCWICQNFKEQAVFVKELMPIRHITTKTNAEAELLCPYLLDKIGLTTLAPTLLIDTNNKKYLMTPALKESYPDAFVIAKYLNDEILNGLDFQVLTKLFVADIVFGNFDRTLNNIFVDLNNNKTELVPIDFSLCLSSPEVIDKSHEFCIFKQVSLDKNDDMLNSLQASKISQKNHLYARLFNNFTSNTMYRKKTISIVNYISNQWSFESISSTIQQIPDSVFYKNPKERKEEILEVLLNRLAAICLAFNT